VLGTPASLTPAKRLNFAGGDLVGDGFAEDVDLTHGQAASDQGSGVSFADGR